MPSIEFLHGSLLALGGVSLAIPVMLHLLTRRRPARVIFPALRLLKSRKQARQRTIQVQHWLLLFLRCLLLGLLALLLARPRIATGGAGLWWMSGLVALFGVIAALLAAVMIWGRQQRTLAVLGLAMLVVAVAGAVALAFSGGTAGQLWRAEEEPVAAAFVVDTAPRMEYRHANQSRIERVREMAQELISQFPASSELAIVGPVADQAVFRKDRRSIERWATSLEADTHARPIEDSIGRAMQLLMKSELPAKELYIFSDLTQAAWIEDDLEAWKELRQRAVDISVQVIDVGVERPQNVGLTHLKLSREVALPHQVIEVAVEVQSLGQDKEVFVELAVETPVPGLPTVIDGEVKLPRLEVVDRKSVRLSQGTAESVVLSLGGLPPGMHHGTVRLSDPRDGMSADDQLYYSVHVRESSEVALVTWRLSERRSQRLQQLIAPSDDAPLSCRLIEGAALGSADLSSSSVLCLVDPAPLATEEWEVCERFVSAGGALAIFLGPQATLTSFDSDTARNLLPGALVRPWRNIEDPFALRIVDYTHPAMRYFEPYRTSIPWSDYPVFRFWELGTLRTGAHVLAEYKRGLPALVEHAVGDGRVMTLTTPIGQSLSDPDTWNWLEGEWPFVLVHEMLGYLAAPVQAHWNFPVGEIPQVSFPDAEPRKRYQVFSPSNTWQELTADERGLLRVPFAMVAGTYRLKATPQPIPMAGFSVNLTADATNLQRVEEASLRTALGGDAGWPVTDTIRQLRREVRLRGSYEAYTPLLLLLALTLACELVVSNWFYGVPRRTNQ